MTIMGKIDTSGWKEFRIGDLFEACLSKDDIQPKDFVEGKIPLVSSGKENNGIIAFVEDKKARLWEANTLTIDMFGKVFYQENPYFAVSHGRVNILLPKISMTKGCLQFMGCAIEKVTLQKYAFNEMCTGTKVLKDNIKLPSTPDGAPDWAYMESYTANLETKVAESLTLLLAAKDAEKKKVDTREWGEFRVGELFEVKISKSVDKGRLEFAEDGEYDFIGRTPLNNGIQGRLNKLKFEANQEDTYSIAQIGMHVCQYRERKWYASQNIFILTPFTEKSHKANKFIATVITRYLDCAYGEDTYATYPTAKTLPHLKIKLPMDKTGQPDWAYMEEYMRKVEEKVKNVLNCFEEDKDDTRLQRN